MKRLGDGFYEQQLIDQQVMQLTGYRYVDGYSNDTDEYTALMNAGATFARKYGLTPGVALTAAQMAQLTSDIVWLVSETVTMPDGSTRQVLVPQVYVRVQPGDIDGSGGLLSADKTIIKAAPGTGDVTNTGTIAGRTLVSITADNIDNLGGRISGGSVALNAVNDINDLGGTIDAKNSMSLVAGHDINVRTTISSSPGTMASASGVDRIAGLYVTNPGGTLVASAGNDMNLIGAIVANRSQAGTSGLTSISAKRDINLGTVQESQNAMAVASPGNYIGLASSREIGTTIATNGTTSLSANNDIIARQATVDAGAGFLNVHADRDLNITSGQSSELVVEGRQTSKKGILSTTTTTTTSSVQTTTSEGSTFSGGLVALSANNDINIEGSHIAGTSGVLVDAGRNLKIVEGRDTSSTSADFDKKKTSPVFDPILMQNRSVGTGIDIKTNSAAASTIQSSEGGVLLEAGNSVFMQGVQVDAAKDLTIKGAQVFIQGATNDREVTGEQRARGGDFDVLGLHDLGHGLGAKSVDTLNAENTSLARTTLTGANVSITATGADGSGGDLHIAGTTINTPGKLSLSADGLYMDTQATVASLDSSSQRKDWSWQQSASRGRSDQTTNYDQLNVGNLAISANHIQAGLGAKDSLDALAQQPGMGWVQQLNDDPNLQGKVNWTKVDEAHKNWDYSHQGLTPEAAAVVTLVVSYFTWGAASGVGAAAGQAVTTSSVAAMGEGGFVAAGGATVSSVVSGAVTAGVSALAGEASVALINNRGDIDGALHDLGNSSNVKNLVSAILTGGVLGSLNLNPTGLPTTGGGSQSFLTQLGQNLEAGAAKAVINTAVNGGSFESNLAQALKGAFLDTAAAQSAFAIGSNIEPGSAANALAHAIAGCAVGAARNGSCGAGAIGAAIGELSASLYDPNATGMQGDTVQFASMMSGIAAALTGLNASDINLASQAGANAAANNWLATQQNAQMKKELAAASSLLDQAQVVAKWALVSGTQDYLTANGIGLGLAEAGISDLKGLASFLANPEQGLSGLKLLINSPDARQQISDSVFQDLSDKIDRIGTALDVGGEQNALQLGKDLGNLVYQVGGILLGADAAAKGGLALASAAASFGTDVLESSALKFMKLNAGTISGFTSADEVNAAMSSVGGWSPAWKSGTTVAQATINPGTTVEMVVNQRQWDLIQQGNFEAAFGGWATFDNVPNLSFARNELALTDAMKSSNSALYAIDVQIKKPINAQIGVVGEQGGADGGANQLHFFVPPADRSSVFQYVTGSGRVLR